MIITVAAKLEATDRQRACLIETIKSFNAAATFAAETGLTHGVFTQASIHKVCYKEIRKQFGLTAQLAVRAIGKAVAFFSRHRKMPRFKSLSATYDCRVMRITGKGIMSLSTNCGRESVKFSIGEHQQAVLDSAIKLGQCSVKRVGDDLFAYIQVHIDAAEARDHGSNVIGVDMGVVNIAADSNGNTYSSEEIEKKRKWCASRRRTLQLVGTRSAKRRIRSTGKAESNHRRTVNHQISRRIVDAAKGTNSAIAIEKLKGIGKGKRFRKSQRARMNGWSFYQLAQFIEYKAEMAGIAVIKVDPRNTSRICSSCGNCDKKSRKNRDEYCCICCGHTENADINAAKNIRNRANVGWPMVHGCESACRTNVMHNASHAYNFTNISGSAS